MLKFFRKHNKKLLAIFMALLLIVWLGGSALTAMVQPDRSANVLGTSRYGDMQEKHRQRLQYLTTIWRRVGLQWEYPLGPSAGEPLNVYDWVLLTREAQKLGFAPRLEDGEEFFTRQGVSREWINTQASRFDIAPEQFYEAVAEYQNVWNASMVVTQAAQVSEAEVRLDTRDTNEKVSVNLVVLRAEPFVDPQATFTEEEMEAFFAEYREQEPGSGRSMTFGYYLPPRVKAEFVKLNLDKIEANLRLSDKTLERRAQSYWRENRTKDPAFLRPPTPTTLPAERPDDAAAQPTTGPAAQAPAGRAPDQESAPADEQPPTTPATDPSSGDGPVTQPAPAPEEPETPQPIESAPTGGEQVPDQPAPQAAGSKSDQPAMPAPVQPPQPFAPPPRQQPQYFDTYPEARQAAIAAVRRQEAAKRAARLAEYLVQRLSEPWFDMELGEDNYKKRPPAVDAPGYYEALIGDLPPEFDYQGALTNGTTDWFTADSIATVPELGSAWLAMPGGANWALRQLAFQVQGLAELGDSANVDRTLYLAQFESCSMPLRDNDGNLFIFRVVAAEPARAPETLDEVRDRVIADLRRQRAYDEALRRANALREQARIDGLEAALKRDTETQEIAGTGDKVVKPRPMARKQIGMGVVPSAPYVPRVGLVDEAFTEALFALGDAEQGKEPCAVIPVPSRSLVTVVEWVKTEHMTTDTYVKVRGEAVRRLQVERVSKARSEWFDPKLIRSRNRFEPTRGDS